MKDKGKVSLDKSEDINLFFTFTSGQTFRWEEKEDYWIGILDKTEIHLKKEEDFLLYQ